jgi:flagellin
MGLTINHNIAALNTQRNLNQSGRALNKSLEKLSSGYKINVAADDPSGLIISEQLRSQTNGLQRAIQNSQEASNVIGISEGALIEINEILRKLNALAIHAANNGITSPEQVSADQAEVDSSIQTIDRIASTTRYSDQFLLNGSKGLVFDRKTDVQTPMDMSLLNVEASRVDQIFKRAGVSMTVAFTGVKTATQADTTLQAKRAYLEADNANASADITGNVVNADQEFYLTGSKGSRLFKFKANTTLGTIASSINNVKESTGIEASLIFASDTTPDVTIASAVTGVGFGSDDPRTAGAAQVYGADINTGLPKVSAIQVVGVPTPNAELKVGLNTDGQGQVYAKVINQATNEIEWYKDADCTMLIGTQSAVGAFSAANGSGITTLSLTLTANAVAGDVYTVGFIGQEMNTGANFDATVTGLSGWNNISMNNSVISGVELGKNTSADGQLYFKATGAAATRKIEVFTDSQMLPDSLVATGTADLSDAVNGNQIRVEAVNDSGLNMTLAFSAAAAAGTETGSIQYNNIGIRISSMEYGSQETLRLQNKQGQLFHNYVSGDDNTRVMIEEGATTQVSGQDALISLNGSPLRTSGLVANVTTADFSGALEFEEGELGASRIGQVGYNVGALFSKAGAMQSVAEAGATIDLVYSYATNARHATSETMSDFIGGMQYQLGAGAGDQERTVYSIPSMVSSNIGRVEIDGKVYTMQDVLAGGDASLQTDPIIALRVITAAIDDVSSLRARLGAFQKNMLQTNINSLEVAVQNITLTESAIRDADMAAETTDFTKNQILQQAGTAMLAQANKASQNILQLLG